MRGSGKLVSTTTLYLFSTNCHQYSDPRPPNTENIEDLVGKEKPVRLLVVNFPKVSKVN